MIDCGISKTIVNPKKRKKKRIKSTSVRNKNRSEADCLELEEDPVECLYPPHLAISI